jgi:hypothetical protein
VTFESAQRAPQPIDPHVCIGHVALRTADIDRARVDVDLLACEVGYAARDMPGLGHRRRRSVRVRRRLPAASRRHPRQDRLRHTDGGRHR